MAGWTCSNNKRLHKANVKAIFCEKTISYSLDDSSEIVELCKKNNVVLAVHHRLRRFDFAGAR